MVKDENSELSRRLEVSPVLDEMAEPASQSCMMCVEGQGTYPW
jgi:hypothetical protein